jgi:deoxyribonuclease V
MDTFELKKEQQKLAHKIKLNDDFNKINTIGGIETVVVGNKLLACVVVCEYPSMKLIEKKTYFLSDPLPFKPGFSAYREMPAMLEAYNLLEQEPDVLIVKGTGILHPRKLGVATHLGLALNLPTIGVTEKLIIGKNEQGKIFLGTELCGFEVITKEHAKPIYISPGNSITLGSCLNIIKNSIQFPHKMPEPLHLAHKIGKKKRKG